MPWQKTTALIERVKILKKHHILALLLAVLMLVPANVMASACDRTSKEPSSSRERVEQLRDSGLGTVEAADPIDPEEEITAIVFLLCFCIAKLEMCHFLAPAGQSEVMHKNFGLTSWKWSGVIRK